jgi:hypothetical protein
MQPELNKSLSPWLTMWYNPRKTIRRILDTNPYQQIFLLSSLIGILITSGELVSKKAENSLPFYLILIITIIGGSVIGIAYVYLMGALLHWTGSKFGGKASTESLRAAFAWSWIPSLWTLPLWIWVLIPFTSRLELNLSLTLISLCFLFIVVIANLLLFYLLISCISEVQQFSGWRSIGSLIISQLIFWISIFIILVPIFGVNKAFNLVF